jgi:putative glutamine amidotransferase
MRPIIGVPTQNLQSIGGVAPDIPPSWVMSHRYVRALTTTSSGATPWLIPALDDDVTTLRAIYEELDGVFLPGGADVEPSSYGEERHPSCDRSDPARDRVELELVRWAMRDCKPVLGVCRGLQIINLAAGGTLVQDISAQRPNAIKHDYFPFRDGYRREHLAHTVRVTPGTRLDELMGTSSREFLVNSMHHQAIDRLGSGLVVSAVAPDGVIEGIETRENFFLVGVQWHPEVLVEGDSNTRRLFEEFISAAGDFRETRATVDSLR